MNKLESRIAKLEDVVAKADNPMVVIHDNHSDEQELYGYIGESVEVIKRAGESDQELLARAVSTSKPRNGLIALYELRRQ